MTIPPNVSESTEEERRDYVNRRYPCIADCDMCGNCAVFRGKTPETAYYDYIKGKRSFAEVSADYKSR